jgi:hypothetical protein
VSSKTKFGPTIRCLVQSSEGIMSRGGPSHRANTRWIPVSLASSPGLGHPQEPTTCAESNAPSRPASPDRIIVPRNRALVKLVTRTTVARAELINCLLNRAPSGDKKCIRCTGPSGRVHEPSRSSQEKEPRRRHVQDSLP